MLRNRATTTTELSTSPTTISNEAKQEPILEPACRSLLSIDQIPAWYGENPHLRFGYRPLSGALAPCFGSWLYVHNQTVNIFTHLIPGILTLVANGIFAVCFSRWYPDATWHDRFVFHVYLTACSVCFGLSATYHTMLCHSHGLADLWVRLDYVGISLLIMGSFVPGLYMSFYCEPGLLYSYTAMIVVMATWNIYLSMNDRFGAASFLTSRLLPFLALGFSAFIPIIHAVFIFPYEQFQKQAGLNYYYVEGVFMLFGVFFLATKFPESWRPGVFDYWGASHQIFHCFVVFGTVSHFLGIMAGFDWNYHHQRCGIR